MSFIQWNAKVRLAGAKHAFIGLGWGMEDDGPGGINKYRADITVEANTQANVQLVRKLPNENVVLKVDDTLAYGPDGIEMRVTYNVSSISGTGTICACRIAWHAGEANAPDGFLSEVETGPIGEEIVVNVTV